MKHWRVVGGAGRGGILVQVEEDPLSREAELCLSAGAVVEELDFVNDRLHFKLLRGLGPEEGWLTVSGGGLEDAVRLPTSKATALAESLPDAERINQDAMVQKAMEALEDGDSAGALAHLDEAIGLGSPTAQMYSRRAQILLEQGRTLEAVGDCSLALCESPNFSKAIKLRARAHVQLERWLEAHTDFQRALLVDYNEAVYQESLAAAAKMREVKPAVPAAAAAPVSGNLITAPVSAAAPAVAAQSPEEPQSRQRWEIVGGADKGGVLVREGRELSSPQLQDRIGTGAIVEELELVGDRLHYLRISGAGPQAGWISIALKDKVLACRVANIIAVAAVEGGDGEAVAEEPPFPAMAPANVTELSEQQQEQQTALKSEAADAAEDGDLERAMTKLTDAIRLGCATALMYSRRAEMLLRLGRPRAAANDCSAALEINPDSAKALKIRARARVKLRQWAEAHSDFQEGLKIDYDEGTYEESLRVAEKTKEMQAVATARRVRTELAAETQQKKLQEKAAAATASATAPPAKSPPEGAKGDGYKKCLVCGFKGTSERDKQVHSSLTGHAGFYDDHGRLPVYKLETRMGG